MFIEHFLQDFQCRPSGVWILSGIAHYLVLLGWNQRDDLRISEFERGCVQLSASCVLSSY